MLSSTRRNFLHQSAILSSAALFPFPHLLSKSLFKRRFKMCVNPGAIGVNGDLHQLLKWADQYGFEAIVSNPTQLAAMKSDELKSFLDAMKSKNISWGSTNLPIDFRKSEEKYQEGLQGLPHLAKALKKAGATRMNTWIMPTHETLSYRENFDQHVERLKEAGRIIGHYDIRLGLEYVGPKTLMARNKFAFMHTMKECKELIKAIDEDNVGIQLDAFHWFCAGEDISDILSLSANEIVTVDLNDARSGITADDQIDGKRELPSASGVIDLKAFLGALITIGYDGPIRAEPFNAELKAMDNEAALKKTYEMMKKSFDLVG